MPDFNQKSQITNHKTQNRKGGALCAKRLATFTNHKSQIINHKSFDFN